VRKLIGCLVLLVGVGGLGFVAATQNAVRMQAAIAANAQATVTSARYSVQTQVTGRDVSVTGIVVDQTELAVLQAMLISLDGVRVVDVSGVQTLPVADPYVLTAIRQVAGAITISGVIPSDADRDALIEKSDDLHVDLSLAAGVPDTDWVDVAGLGLIALSHLKYGELTLIDRTLTLRGLVRNPDELDATLNRLKDLPEAYSLITEIDVEDDGTPLRLSLTLRDDVATGEGKLPSDITASAIAGIFGTRDGVAITQSVISASDPQWPVVARTAMEGLSQLIDGVLEMTGRDVSLTGTGTPNGIAQAGTLLAALPDTYTVTVELGLWDDGAPLEFTMQWDGSVASASGKYPAGFVLRDPVGVAVANAGANSFRPAETARFGTNAAVGTSALGLLSTGTLRVNETAITLTGTAVSPQVGLALDSALSNAAPDTEITREITYLDDGSPAAWTLTYDAANGAIIEGRLPSGLAIGDIDLALGLDVISGTPATALDDNDLGSSMETLRIVAEYLPEVETLIFARSEDQNALDLVLSPGVDLDLVANDLADRLPTDVAFSLSPPEDLPDTGTTRTNTATGHDEIFTDGFWLPYVVFDTDVDVAACAVQTLNILERGQIGFLSSSARLDATSIRTINALAAVVLPCVAADLTLEVGGHTDASGAELTNNDLSQDRANAVRAALVARGVPEIALTAFGFGQTQPIAENTTPEGRAANRRTDITWFAVGALRDP
jgi:OOP family OmpA-OmpF porin